MEIVKVVRKTRRFIMSHVPETNTRSGKVTLASIFGAGAVLILSLGFFFQVNVHQVSADDVSTSVTVLNTPPQWDTNAAESPASSTSTPTNTGSSVTWTAQATDSNTENYYLLICKTGGAPTANSSAVPSCNGGLANRWAVSASTASGAVATAATTTTEAMVESNDWYAWVCDANASLPQCNAVATQGNGDFDSSSPFYVNHPPVFNAISNNGPVIPGGTLTWTTTAVDTDTVTAADTIQLIVCRTASFSNGTCTGGAWATSTLVASNAATTTPIGIPYQDATYNAYVYVIDNHGHAATSSRQGFNSSFAVSNVAPTISAATVALLDTDNTGNLTLLTPAGTSGPYKVTFDVSDDNSCQNASSGNEIQFALANTYRSGVTSASCDTEGEFNSNNCYSYGGYTNYSCTQNIATCSGASDTSVTWTCTFSMWFNADPTVASTQFPLENWLASARVNDDNAASSTLTEAVSGNELETFLAFNITDTSIPYGGLQPSQQGAVGTTTDLLAQGNVGLNETLYGDTMCTTWTAADSCDTNGISPTNDIIVSNQKFATSSVAYSSPFASALTSSSSPSSVAIKVQKTIATTSIQSKFTYWGIAIPGTITVSGNYFGQNTITAVTSSASDW